MRLVDNTEGAEYVVSVAGSLREWQIITGALDSWDWERQTEEVRQVFEQFHDAVATSTPLTIDSMRDLINHERTPYDYNSPVKS